MEVCAFEDFAFCDIEYLPLLPWQSENGSAQNNCFNMFLFMALSPIFLHYSTWFSNCYLLVHNCWMKLYIMLSVICTMYITMPKQLILYFNILTLNLQQHCRYNSYIICFQGMWKPIICHHYIKCINLFILLLYCIDASKQELTF